MIMLTNIPRAPESSGCSKMLSSIHRVPESSGFSKMLSSILPNKNKITSRPSRLHAWPRGMRCLHLALVAFCLLIGTAHAASDVVEQSDPAAFNFPQNKTDDVWNSLKTLPERFEKFHPQTQTILNINPNYGPDNGEAQAAEWERDYANKANEVGIPKKDVKPYPRTNWIDQEGIQGGNKKFLVMQFNILAHGLSKPGGFGLFTSLNAKQEGVVIGEIKGKKPVGAAPFSLRLRRVLSIILDKQPHIVGLQEVDFYKEFEYVLNHFGYEGKFKPKGKCSATVNYNGGYNDGVAVFWKRDMLELENPEDFHGFDLPIRFGDKHKALKVTIDKGDELIQVPTGKTTRTFKKDRNKQQIICSGNEGECNCEEKNIVWNEDKTAHGVLTETKTVGKQCGLSILLKVLGTKDQYLGFLASHNKSGKADDDEGPIKVKQGEFLAKQVAEMKKKRKNVAVIMTCDLNTDYHKNNGGQYDVYGTITKNVYENIKKEDFQQMYDAYEQVIGQVLPYTCPKLRNGGEQKDKVGITMAAIDFIFHCSKLRALRVLGLPEADEKTMTKHLFPNHRFPSDHPYIMAELELVPEGGKKTSRYDGDKHNDMINKMKQFKVEQVPKSKHIKMDAMVKDYLADKKTKIYPNADGLLKWAETYTTKVNGKSKGVFVPKKFFEPEDFGKKPVNVDQVRIYLNKHYLYSILPGMRIKDEAFEARMKVMAADRKRQNDAKFAAMKEQWAANDAAREGRMAKWDRRRLSPAEEVLRRRRLADTARIEAKDVATMSPSELVMHRRRLAHGVRVSPVLAALTEEIEEALRNHA